MALTPTPGQWEYVRENRTERSANGSSEFCELVRFDLDYLLLIVTMIIDILGLVGNCTVLWLLGFRIQRNPFSVYILNLAAADALLLCCAFLTSLNELVHFFPLSIKDAVYLFLTYIFYIVGLSLLAAISTERCLSVLFPFWYRCHRPKHTSALVCAVLWTLGVLLCLSPLFFQYVLENPHDISYLDVVILSLWFTLLTCVLCVSSLTLLLRVQCSSQGRQPPRLYLLVLLTVLVFLLCGLAPGIRLVSCLFGTHFTHLWISWLLACVNSSTNPFIYFFLGSLRHKRREPLRVLLQRALADDQELGRESGDMLCTDTLETSS